MSVSVGMVIEGREGMSVGKSNGENAMKKYEKILKNFFGEVFQREKVWLGKRKHAWNSTEDLKKNMYKNPSL